MEKKNETLKFLDVIAQAIFDKKGVNILGLDVTGISTMTDYLIIAEGSVNRHLKAICDCIVDAMKQRGCLPLHIEGQRETDWVIIDYGNIIIHLFIPELREKYALEQLWHEGKIIDLNIIVSEDTSNAYYV